MGRSGRIVQLVLALLLAPMFVLAELGRSSDPVRATLLSMAGWTAFALLYLAWLWEDCGLRLGGRRLGRLVALTAVASVVLFLSYRRSELLAAGIEVDAGYTFLGVTWFLGLDNPITYAGRTTSFAQFPLAMMTHLPAHLVGFGRLGPFAIHLGIMLQVALLLALLTVFLVDRRLLVQIAIVALAAAVFSNRTTLLLYNLTGYAIPAVTVGVLFLVTTLGDQTPSVLMPRVGGLLTLAILHHYPGVFFVVPLVAAWVVLARRPGRRIASFVRANLPLWMAVLVAVICVAIRPELLMNRLRAVTSPSLALDEFESKVVQNWAFLNNVFPGVFVRDFFRRSAGSWHLLTIPPLGGFLPYVVAAGWLVTAVALGRRGLVFIVRLAVLALLLLVLTALQHVVTGFENYRDMMLVIGLVTSSIGFVFLIPRVGAVLRLVLIGFALGVATFNWVDVVSLAGQRYGVFEYAPAAQATAEQVRRFWRRDSMRLRGTMVAVVVHEPFPLEPIYAVAARDDGFELRFVGDAVFCRDPARAVAELLAASCQRTAFAVPATTCRGRWAEALGWPPPRSTMAFYSFEAACGGAPTRTWASPAVADLEP